MQQGSLVCVGTGMMVGAHLSPICQSHIEQADVVFVCVAEHYMEAWITSLNKNTVNLQTFYGEGKDRHDTYAQMTSAMLERVEKGEKVVGAFYGHPGVFAKVPHDAIAIAKSRGFDAYMLPGISAESCLYADLGIDPGALGCQHYEANQFLLYKREVDTAAYLVLWQVGGAGDSQVPFLPPALFNEKSLLINCYLFTKRMTALFYMKLQPCPSMSSELRRLLLVNCIITKLTSTLHLSYHQLANQ